MKTFHNNTTSCKYVDYFSVWDELEKQAFLGQERDEAVSQLKDFLANNSDALQLDCLNLFSQPDNLPLR
ncbi:leucine-rich repeat domain-containing protein [Escherichia coli]|uniref:leucine-rich repeat domain-containing protein n=1 Tax=Escherichia coli TaxID=562 RepID=UPI00278BD960|nr:leucine-rich repeat domain-containing protein [Escherichia coli]